MMILFVLLILFLNNKVIIYLPNFCKKPLVEIKKKIVYNTLIRISMESYMPISLATFVGILNFYAENSVDKVNAILSFFLVIYLVVLPYYCYQFLRVFKSTLH
jgi:amino acid permease